MRTHPFPHFGPAIEAAVIQEDILSGLPFAVQRMKQVHGDRVWIVTDPKIRDYEPADAMITELVELPLMVTTADCQPLVLADPERRIIAAIHAGWKSLVQDIIPKTLNELIRLGASPEHLKVGIGPSLGLCCSRFENPLQEIPEKFHWAIREGQQVDLNAISDRQLEEARIPKENIVRMNICTSTNLEWFSYRRNQTENRFGTYIKLLLNEKFTKN